jgi:hypothetical protein
MIVGRVRRVQHFPSQIEIQYQLEDQAGLGFGLEEGERPE